MRRSRVVAIAPLFILALTTSTVIGQITLDENGHGFGPSGALPFIVGPDPLSGIVTLKYELPFPITPGDLVLGDSDTGAASDILRFYTQSVFFLSDLEDGEVPPFDLADVQTLPLLQPGFFFFFENGPEGNNGFVWTPPAGTPGAPIGGGTVQYNIISDGVVPEPDTNILALIGAAIIAGITNRRLLVL